MARSTKQTRRANIFSCFFVNRRTQRDSNEMPKRSVAPAFPVGKTAGVLAPTDNETSSSNTSTPLVQIPAARRSRRPPRDVWNHQSIASEVTIDPLLMTVVAGHDYPGARASRLGHSGITIRDTSETEQRDDPDDNDTVATGSYLLDASMISDVTGYDVVSV